MIAVALVLALVAPAPATADDETDAFHAAVAGAYRYYREAYHYFETGSTDLAGISLDDFIAAWKAIVERYADKPPPGYAKDAAFAESLDLIAGKAASAVGAAPHETLLVLRELRGDFAALRRRSNQVVFSDCIDAMNAAFDRLWALRQPPPRSTKELYVSALKAAIGDTDRAYRSCRDEAPAALRDNDEFQRLFGGALASLEKLSAADPAQADAILSILRELHSFDKLIWLLFG